MDRDFSLERLEERLRRVEALLGLVLEALERIERLLEGPREESVLARRLVMLFSMPVGEAVRAAREIVGLARSVASLGELDLLVLEAVAARPGSSLRELEREVRRVRGRASRETIKRALERLERAGLVRVEYDGRAYRVWLASRRG